MKILNVDKLLSEELQIQLGGKTYIIKSAIPAYIAEEFILLNNEILEKGLLIDFSLTMKFLGAIVHCLKAFDNEASFEELKKTNLSIAQIIACADFITRLIWFSPEDVLNEKGELKNLESLLKNVPKELIEEYMEQIKKQNIEKLKKKKKKK